MPAVENNPLRRLSRKTGRRWPVLSRAQSNADEKCTAIKNRLNGAGISFPPELDLVVCGSLGRGEWTRSSDVDWFLLINGAVSNAHLQLAKVVESNLKKEGQEPGRGGPFGNMVFSHELVHVIGGHSDNNNNMTRRLLLLLESRSLQNGLARKQIMKAILERYFEEDTHFRPTGRTPSYVPRFLVNDIVRFWRTICVDYASKHRAEAGHKWALRNIKLRFSRKLLFAAGLIVAFECHLNPPPMKEKGYARFSGDYDEPNTTLFINHIMPYLEWTPLEILAHAVGQYACNAKVADLIFGSYNQFLKQIDDKNMRKSLEKMDYKTAQKNRMYNELRDLSHQFQQGLDLLFFPKSKTKLSVLTQKYGLF